MYKNTSLAPSLLQEIVSVFVNLWNGCRGHYHLRIVDPQKQIHIRNHDKNVANMSSN